MAANPYLTLDRKGLALIFDGLVGLEPGIMEAWIPTLSSPWPSVFSPPGRSRPSTSARPTASRRGQNYITLFMDMVARTLLFATEGRDTSTAKAKARGYRTTRNIIAIAYLIAGKLRFDGLAPLWGSPLGSATLAPT
jgi:hypothetical protein